MHKKANKDEICFFSIMIIVLSCNTPSKKDKGLEGYLKNKNLKSIKIDSFSEDSLHVLPNFDEIFVKMKRLKKSEGIWKYWPKRKLLLEYSSLEIDTLYTNGKVFQFKDVFFISDIHLFKVPGDTISK